MMRAATPLHRQLAAALLLVGLAAVGGARAQGSPDDEAQEEPGADALPPAPNPDGEATQSGDETASDSAPGTTVQAFAGFGLGTRSMERPTRLGAQRLNDSFFPAAEAGLRVLSSAQHAFALGFLLHYQTSIGMTVTEEPLFALSNRLAVRSERVELSVAPSFRLGDSKQALGLAFPIGASLRTFWPEVHDLTTPGYSLLGPQLRAELVAPLTSALGLRLGPELIWIIAIDRSLKRGGVAAQGFAIGAEATLELQLGGILALQLAYRESHAYAPNAGNGPTFTDVERFLTGRLAGAL